MQQTERKEAITKLENDHATGELIMMQVVNRLYDLERDYEIPFKEIAEHITNKDIRANFLALQRKKK